MTAFLLRSRDRLFPKRNAFPFSWPVLGAVLLAHALIAAWMMAVPAPAENAVMPPMAGILIAEASPAGNHPSPAASQRPEKSADTAAAGKPQTDSPPLRPAEKKTTAASAADSSSKTDSGEHTIPAAKESGTAGSPGAFGETGGGNGAFSAPRLDTAGQNNPKPRYPVASRRLGEEGRVILSVHVLASGQVDEVRLKQSSGFPRLDNAAMEAVKKWRYLPARRGNTPVPYWYAQPVDFSLTD